MHYQYQTNKYFVIFEQVQCEPYWFCTIYDKTKEDWSLVAGYDGDTPREALKNLRKEFGV